MRLTLAAIALAAPIAAHAEPLNWQCNQECFQAHGINSPTGWDDEIIVAGYRYDWPTGLVVAPTILPPITPPVPEPAAWVLALAGLAALKLRIKST